MKRLMTIRLQKLPCLVFLKGKHEVFPPDVLAENNGGLKRWICTTDWMVFPRCWVLACHNIYMLFGHFYWNGILKNTQHHFFLSDFSPIDISLFIKTNFYHGICMVSHLHFQDWNSSKRVQLLHGPLASLVFCSVFHTLAECCSQEMPALFILLTIKYLCI